MIFIEEIYWILPEFESDELVDEFGGVGDRAAHIDYKLKKEKKTKNNQKVCSYTFKKKKMILFSFK